jgi:hypothetical protein
MGRRMGHREDLVRQRIADEERREREKADMKARTEAAALVRLNEEYDELIAAFDKEGERIAKLLEDADWSQAVLKDFTYTKKHWWSRKRTVELACFQFARSLNGFWGWMSSSNHLYLGDGNGWLRTPSEWFDRPTAGDTRRGSTMHRMKVVLQELQQHQSAEAA